MQKILIYLIIGVVILFAGCGLHRPDVQQGNILEPDIVAQLHPGLSKKQVEFLMGTPVIEDPFHPDRWDYVYWLKSQGKATMRRKVTVFFVNDAVSRVEMEGVAPTTSPPPAGKKSPAIPASPQ